MFETLFGAEVPAALKFFLAFVIVLALIGVTAWLVRRFGAERFGGSAARGRQPRLAVVDAAAVDGRRRLVIIRRDNVEHLLMIGGPTDVVVEQNIVRAMGAPRDKTMDPTAGRGLSISETLTRPVPLGEGSTFPLQPETNGRAPRTIPEEPVQWTWPAQPEPQRPSPRLEPRLEKPEKPDTFTNLADELSARPAVPREPNLTRPVTPPPISRPAPTPPAPVAAASAAPVEKVEKTEKTTTIAEPDQNLTDMANLLGASLRRGNELRAETPASMKAEPIVPPAPPRMTPSEPRMTPPEPKPARTEAKPAQPEAKPKALYDSLEEEMASLLGRPPGKT